MMNGHDKFSTLPLNSMIRTPNYQLYMLKFINLCITARDKLNEQKTR